MQYLRAWLCISILVGLALWPGPVEAQPPARPSPPERTQNLADQEPPDPGEQLPPPPPENPLQVPADWQSIGSGQAPLTIQEALELALQHNATILAADADARQSYWAYQKAGSIPNTNLVLSTYQGTGQALLNGNYIAQNRGDYFVTLQQPFWPLGSLGTASRAGREGYLESLHRSQVTRLTVIQAVKDNFFTMLAAQQQVRVAEENYTLADQVYQLAKKRFEAGAGPRLDLVNAGIAQSQAEQELVKAQSILSQARDRLGPLLGLPAHQALAASGVLTPPDIPLVYNELARLAQDNPRVAAEQTALEKLKLQVKLAQQANNPTPSLAVTYDAVSPSYLVWMQVAFPLDWGQLGNEVRNRQEQVAEQQAMLQQALLSVSSDLKVAYDAFEAASLNASRYQEKVLNPSVESVTITQFGYSRGAIPYLQLLTAMQRLQDVKIEHVNLLLAQRLAYNALEAAVGRTLEGASNP